MNIQQIDYLREAAHAGSFSRAADAMGLSQSILSRQVAALEQELGCALLQRHGRGVVLTEAGGRLLEIGQTFVQEIALLKAAHQGSDGTLTGTFKLGVPMFFSQSVAPLLMSRVRSGYPGVTLVIREGHSGDLLSWLLAGELDATVIYESKRPRQFGFDALFDEPVFVVGALALAKRFSLALDQPLTLAQLAQLPLLIPTQRHGTRLDLDLVMKRHQLTPHIVHEIDALGARMLLVREGAGVTIFESAGLADARRDPALFVLPIAEGFSHKLVWVEARGQDGRAQWRTFAQRLKRDIALLRSQLDS